MSPRSLVLEYLDGRECHPEYRRAMIALAGRLSDLTAAAINAHLRMRAESCSATTVANERRMVLTLWRWAWEEGRISEAPRGVMKIKNHQKPVRAWTISECRELVKGAEKFFGQRLRNGADVGRFLQCWVLLAYETGARYGDVFAWRKGNFAGSTVSWVTSKTGVPCTRVVSHKAMDLVADMLNASPDDRVLGWVCCRRQSFRLMRNLIASCLPGGSGRWLRRSAATHLELNQPGKAQWFLAHKTAGLAARHYLDQSQLVSETLKPPSIY